MGSGARYVSKRGIPEVNPKERVELFQGGGRGPFTNREQMDAQLNTGNYGSLSNALRRRDHGFQTANGIPRPGQKTGIQSDGGIIIKSGTGRTMVAEKLPSGATMIKGALTGSPSSTNTVP